MSESNENMDHCHHIVARKKRFCRMHVKPGEKYCAEHQMLESSENTAQIRIVCPLDPKHTCYTHNLKKHLKICNARPQPSLPYIQNGINADEPDTDTYRLLASFSSEDVKRVVRKVNQIYEELLVGKTKELFCEDKLVEEEMAKPEYGDKTKKHLKQASAILGLLERYELIKSNSKYIEFGAGRGQLSYWLALKTKSFENCSFLLIERASPKHKRDNKLDHTENEIQRIRADIADIVLDQLEVVNRNSHLVGVTKHLCGAATDLALRCLTNVSEQKTRVNGCIMTFCCHHRCRWGCYTGKRFFQENDLSKNDFDMLCGMSSWATCGSGLSRKRRTEDVIENAEILQNERDKEIGLNRQQKEEIGRRCKNIINWGRLKYMEEQGFKVALHYYVPSSVSLENVCIVAFKQ